MPIDPPLADTKDQMLPKLCEEAGAIQEPTDPKTDIFHIEIGMYVCWIKSNTMLFCQIQNAACQSVR